MTQSQKDAFYDKLFATIVSELKGDEEFLKYVLNDHFGMTKKEVFEAYPNIKNLIAVRGRFSSRKSIPTSLDTRNSG